MDEQSGYYFELLLADPADASLTAGANNVGATHPDLMLTATRTDAWVCGCVGYSSVH